LICIHEHALLSTLIGGLDAIEHLRLGEVAENLYTIQQAEKFLQLVLTKQRRTPSQIPHVVDITHQSVLLFKSRANSVTDTYENDDSFVTQAKGTCCMATYRIVGNPQLRLVQAVSQPPKQTLLLGGYINHEYSQSNKTLRLPLGFQACRFNWRPRIHHLDSNPPQTVAVF
jgi:hypothetical protein